MTYIVHDVKIQGLGPILAHNGRMSNPLDEWSKALKKVSSKRGKTEADYMELSQIEFQGSLYLDHKKKITWDSRSIEAMLCEGARKTKMGKQALAGCFVEDKVKFTYEGTTSIKNRMKDMEEFALVVSVKVQRVRVMRTRPIFREWEMEFQVSLNDAIAESDHLRQWLQDAGSQVGIGDWRPRYGRFHVNHCKAIRD